MKKINFDRSFKIEKKVKILKRQLRNDSFHFLVDASKVQIYVKV